ncbi:MAG: hypothetical protein ABFS38_09980 [Bacteroidota bacterium]
MGVKVRKIFLPNHENEEAYPCDTGSTDVIVLSENGSKYLASFFTYDNIVERRLISKRNGEYMDGLYFWDKNMIIVEECSLTAIQKVVLHLIDEGEFQEAFKQL